MNFSTLDWLVFITILILVIAYGLHKGRSSKSLDGYFLGDRVMSRWMVLLGVMGTQASAITFLTVPGQAFTDGTRFIQFYFGLPIAMVVLSCTLLPIYRKLKVYTAYEYLQSRFDKKTRLLASVIFLISRGLSTGISIVAPALILHNLLGWNIYLTNLVMGGLLIIYTTIGGAKSVAYTQQIQFLIIYAAMFVVAWWAIKGLPGDITFGEALHIAGKSGKLNSITSGFENGSFDWSDKYNILSGIIGGFFLQLSYFGADQSQVGRYLTASSTSESKIGLLMNGLIKIPLQFSILFIGILIFLFYHFNSAPVSFDYAQENLLKNSAYKSQYQELVVNYDSLQLERANWLKQTAREGHDFNEPVLREKLNQFQGELKSIQDSIGSMARGLNPLVDGNKNANFVFLRFVMDNLPKGIVGLIVAVIFLAAWSSIAASLNSLSSSTIVDVHKSFAKQKISNENEYWLSKRYTLLWGLFCIAFTFFATNIGNSLVEAVNILGSWFYGTLLGIFLVGFYFKHVKGTAVFYSAIISEVIVIIFSLTTKLSFVWFTVIGTIIVIVVGLVLQKFFNVIYVRRNLA